MNELFANARIGHAETRERMEADMDNMKKRMGRE
jgi:hypothetical protein